MTHLAIIGAGAAGLAAARALRSRRPDLSIAIFEQGDVPGGRVATGRRGAYAFDHGAQYVKAATPELERLLIGALPADELHDIGRPVWTFDGSGTIVAGDPAQNADPKWTYATGLDRLPALLAQGLDIRFATPIARVEQRPGLPWLLHDTAAVGVAAAPLAADLILLTPPAPEAAALLAASALDPAIGDLLKTELARASYRRCISIALAYDTPITRPFYALVNTDRAHAISWLACEHDKGPARCPPGQSLLVAQMAPGWSAEQWDAPDETLARAATRLSGALLGEALPTPLMFDIRRWPHALPDAGADFDTLNQTHSGLFFAGDYTLGQGRVHLAIESGWRAAGAIEQALAPVRSSR
jgi:predicted NAD/FAD-dependent oxidoreductase